MNSLMWRARDEICDAIKRNSSGAVVLQIVSKYVRIAKDLYSKQQMFLSNEGWGDHIASPDSKMTFAEFLNRHGLRDSWSLLEEMQDHSLVVRSFKTLPNGRVELKVYAYGYYETKAWWCGIFKGTKTDAAMAFFRTREGATSLFLDSEHRNCSRMEILIQDIPFSQRGRWLKRRLDIAISQLINFDNTLKRLDNYWPYRMIKIIALPIPKVELGSAGIQTEDSLAVNHILMHRDSSPLERASNGDLIDMDQDYESVSEMSRPYTAYSSYSFDSVYEPNPECS